MVESGPNYSIENLKSHRIHSKTQRNYFKKMMHNEIRGKNKCIKINKSKKQTEQLRTHESWIAYY